MSTAGRTTRSFAAAASALALITVVARIVGFGRWLVFSHSVGGTCVGQVYATANQLPNVLYEVAAGGALAAVAVPLISHALHRDERAEGDQVASALLTWALSILIPLAALLFLCAPLLAQFFVGNSTSGCDAAGSRQLATDMIRIFAPQVALYGVGIVLAGVLQAHRRFIAAAVAPLLSSVVVIVSYLWYRQLVPNPNLAAEDLSTSALVVLAGGTTLGVVALSLPLIAPIRAAGIRLRMTWHFPADTGRRALALAGAGVLALAAQQAAVLSTVWISGHRGPTGTLNVYNYIQALYLLPYAVLAVPIATAAFPRLVSEAPEVLRRTLPLVIAASSLGVAVLVAVAPPATVFFTHLDAGGDSTGRSALGALDTGLTAYSVGLVGFSMAALLVRTCYAQGITWRAGAIVAVGWVIAGLAPLLVVRSAGSAQEVLATLGWSSTIGMTVTAIGLLALVGQALGVEHIVPAARTLVVALAAVAIGGFAGRATAFAVGPDGLGSSMLTGVLAAAVAMAVFGAVMALGDRQLVAAAHRAVTNRRRRTMNEDAHG